MKVEVNTINILLSQIICDDGVILSNRIKELEEYLHEAYEELSIYRQRYELPVDLDAVDYPLCKAMNIIELIK